MDEYVNRKYLLQTRLGTDRSGTLMTMSEPDGSRSYYTKLLRVDNSRLSAMDLYSLQLRFKRLSSIHHSNTLTVFEPEVAEEGLLLRQNDLPGQSLAALLRKNGRPLPHDLALSIASDVVAGLAALHDQNIVHGEVDPSHVLLDNSGHAYLSFLPLPPVFDSESMIYLEPGRNLQDEPQKSDDVYAFGLLLVTLFTGTPLYRHDQENMDAFDRERVRQYYSESMPRYAGPENDRILPIIEWCLSENPDKRYTDCEEIYWVIRQLQHPSEAGQTTVPVQKKESRPKGKKIDLAAETAAQEKEKRPVWPILVSVLFLALAAGFLFYKFRSVSNAEDVPEYRETLNVLYITQTVLAEIEPTATATAESTPTEEATPTFEPPTAVPTETPLPEPVDEGIGHAVVWNSDGSEMVSVPAGTFTMGQNDTFLYTLEGILPQHQVKLDGFWIDAYEVTQAQYAKCVNAGACSPVERVEDSLIGDDMPIMNAKWDDAQAYCSWVGKRLPSEAEWEKAARSTDHRIYPWGNSSPNVSETASFRKVRSDPLDLSPYGAHDMAGNVSEWTSDFFSETRMIGEEELVNPIGPISGNMHTVKGGNASDSDRELSGFVFLRWGSAPDVSPRYGFRCAVPASEMDTGKAVPLPSAVKTSPALSYSINENGCEDKAGFVADVTIPDGSKVTRGKWVTKTWRLKNVGTCAWNENYKIIWSDEENTNPQRMFDIGIALEPGEEGEVSITFRALGSGKTKVAFLMANTEGQTFGLGERGRGQLWMEYYGE